MSRAIFHLTSFMWAVVFSYFFFPKNLSSPLSVLSLLVINFVVSELIILWMESNKKGK